MSSPVQATKAFVASWGNQDFGAMLGTVQPSWRIGRNHAAVQEREAHEDNVGYTARARLEMWFGDDKLIMADVDSDVQKVDIKEFSDVMVDVPVELVIKDRFGRLSRQRRVVRVICEDESGSPTPDGEWKVNPVSVMRTR